MCKRCIIFTYDEVLDIVMKLEVGAPLNFNPDWPVRTTEAYPKSVAPLIVPKFDTAASAPAFAPGSLGVRELSWGFEESWKPGVVFNTRIESATKPTWQESMQHRRCILPVPAFFRLSLWASGSAQLPVPHMDHRHTPAVLYYCLGYFHFPWK